MFEKSGDHPERLEQLCGGECDHPSERRRRITRIEVVRVRPQLEPGEPVLPLLNSTCEDHAEAYRRIARCGIELGYDCIPFERPVCRLVQDGAGLMGHAPAIIETMDEIEAYPWDKKLAEFIEQFEPHYDALRTALPEGMKAVGGIGNGLFETMQDFVPFQELAFLQVDEPEAYEVLWQRVGDLQYVLWKWLLENHRDSFAVCRFGDDLGFINLNPCFQPKSATNQRALYVVQSVYVASRHVPFEEVQAATQFLSKSRTRIYL